LKIKTKLEVSIEAGCGLGWEKFIGCDGLKISLENYGVSAPEPVIADHYGFTTEKIYQKIVDQFINNDQ